MPRRRSRGGRRRRSQANAEAQAHRQEELRASEEESGVLQNLLGLTQRGKQLADLKRITESHNDLLLIIRYLSTLAGDLRTEYGEEQAAESAEAAGEAEATAENAAEAARAAGSGEPATPAARREAEAADAEVLFQSTQFELIHSQFLLLF